MSKAQARPFRCICIECEAEGSAYAANGQDRVAGDSGSEGDEVEERERDGPAMAASHSKSHLATLYKRLLAAGKAKLTALGALMRHVVVIANARHKDYENSHGGLT